MNKTHQVYKNSSGKRVPGATTIIDVLAKPQLIVWANRMGLDGINTTEYVDELADVGKLVHYLILCKFKDSTPDLSDFTENQQLMASASMVSFESWLSHHEVEPILTEQPIVSDELNFGGTPDLLCNLDGIPTLVDFKSGRSLHVEVILQLSAYSCLLGEIGFSVHQALALRIGRESGEGFEVKDFTVDVLTDGLAAFKSCLDLYRQMQGIRKAHWGNKK